MKQAAFRAFYGTRVVGISIPSNDLPPVGTEGGRARLLPGPSVYSILSLFAVMIVVAVSQSTLSGDLRLMFVIQIYNPIA